MVCLTLDPGFAFGTGTHPTTFITLGVDTAVAVDIDAQAVLATQQNARLNTLEARIQCLQGSLEVVAGRFPLIVANIYLGPLIEMLPIFARRVSAGGHLLLSGLLAAQEETLQERLLTVGFTVRTRLEQEGWIALAAQHKNALKALPQN
jgi:ribosomal protein L11 methyltransferase